MSGPRFFRALVVILLIAFGAIVASGQFEPWERNQGRDRDENRPRWGRGRMPNAGACFFRDANFGGDYFCVRPGEEIKDVPSGFNDSISSVRVLGNSTVTIYPDSNFRGQFLQFHQSIPDLGRYSEPGGRKGWNDRVSSIRIQGGAGGYAGGNYPSYEVWNQKQQPQDGACFYTDAKFRGNYFCMGLGQQAGGLPPQFNDSISSIRIFGRAKVRFWQNGNFEGQSAEIDRNMEDLGRWREHGRWNDQITSIMVR